MHVFCHARTSCFPGLYWENFKFLRKWYLKNENPFTDYELNATGNMTFHQKQLEYIFIIITCKSCPITPPVCAKKKAPIKIYQLGPNDEHLLAGHNICNQ